VVTACPCSLLVAHKSNECTVNQMLVVPVLAGVSGTTLVAGAAFAVLFATALRDAHECHAPKLLLLRPGAQPPTVAMIMMMMMIRLHRALRGRVASALGRSLLEM
jgi:hypothetical protein